MYDAPSAPKRTACLQFRPVGIFARFALPSVKPEEAMDMLRSGATLLDVRENAEWNAGHVPGAVHLPAKNVAAQALKRLPKGRPVVVTCRTGARSRGVTRILREKGIDAVNLSGGMAAWESAGGRIVGKGNRPGMIA
jgi:rhodanese-related sulfurtransferase